jgi:hypothetical protein
MKTILSKTVKTISALMSFAFIIIAFASEASAQSLSPIRVSLKRTESKVTGTNRGVNTYQVDWEITGALPAGVSGIQRFRACVIAPEGTGCADTGGSARSATVRIEWVDDGIASGRERSLTPHATVDGFSDCQKRISRQQGAVTTSGTCPMQLSFNGAPQITSTRSSGSTAPSGAGGVGVPANTAELPTPAVKVDWSVGLPLPANLNLKGFTISVRAKFSRPDPNRPSIPGQSPAGAPTAFPASFPESFSATAGPEARSKTVALGNGPTIGGAPAIEEVSVAATAEIRISGRSQ